MTYVDGFVAAVPTANREAYKRHVEQAADVFRKHGALKVVECWGDDVPDGKLTSFPMAVKKQDDETVVFSWILWPSRQARDEGMRKVMARLPLSFRSHGGPGSPERSGRPRAPGLRGRRGAV